MAMINSEFPGCRLSSNSPETNEETKNISSIVPDKMTSKSDVCFDGDIDHLYLYSEQSSSFYEYNDNDINDNTHRYQWMKAIDMVRNEIINNLDKSGSIPVFGTHIVWKCKVLQNWKYLISSTLNDGMYYEVTYNSNKKEWYLVSYKKWKNKIIKDEET